MMNGEPFAAGFVFGALIHMYTIRFLTRESQAKDTTGTTKLHVSFYAGCFFFIYIFWVCFDFHYASISYDLHCLNYYF